MVLKKKRIFFVLYFLVVNLLRIEEFCLVENLLDSMSNISIVFIFLRILFFWVELEGIYLIGNYMIIFVLCIRVVLIFEFLNIDKRSYF